MIPEATRNHARSLSEELDLAMKAALAAGRILKDGYGKCNEVQSKDVGDLVSEIDVAADRAATHVIHERSDLPILSEELNGSTPPQADLWIIDPLDGSSAFLMQAGPQYPSVLVALRRHNQTKVGVAYFPLVGDVYYAQQSRGAWRNGKRLICPNHEPLSDVWVELNQYGNQRWETDFFRELRERIRSTAGARLVTSNAPNSGVAMRMAHGHAAPAAAIHDNNTRHPKQGPWDIAPAQIILEEAGGVFLNPAGGRTDPFVAEPVIAARSPRLAHQVLELVDSVSAGS